MNLEQGDKCYRTLVRGKLVQRSGLTVGGSPLDPTGSDIQCHRDGRGRLTVPGSSLAGAFIETAARICPELVESRGPVRLHNRYAYQDLDRLSGKSRDGCAKVRPPREGESEMYQSLLYVYPCHMVKMDYPVERRQGVGIRQRTGAAAIDQRALFDHEVVPAGTGWDFLTEIDTCRAGACAESLILLALLEWAQDRCWLGASVARGTGWLTLADLEVLRLPMTEDAVEAWPTNSKESLGDLWEVAQAIGGARIERDIATIYRTATTAFGVELPPRRFWYLTIDARLSAGRRSNGYGLDAFSIGGHNAQPHARLAAKLLVPNGIHPEKFQQEYDPDMPVVTMQRQSVASAQEGTTAAGQQPRPVDEPFIPGSSIRGPLRHATSCRRRGLHQEEVPDPNEPGSKKSSQRCHVAAFRPCRTRRRLLVRDALLTDEAGGDYKLALFQHHAEDEFTAGVYGTTKHDRTAIVDGAFDVRLVIEAQDVQGLRTSIEAIYPTLKLAELGHLPLGRAKWGGLGWIPWRFNSVVVAQAGSRPGIGADAKESEEGLQSLVARALAQLSVEEQRHGRQPEQRPSL